MKDSYVGDIGDFSNNGLLRHLCGGPGLPAVVNPLRLGIVWCLNQDGRVNHYPDLAVCDPVLHQGLQQLVHERNPHPNIDAFCEAGILPADTLYYDELVPRGNRDAQTDWLQGALDTMEDAELVFLNPDNGISSEPDQAGPEHISLGGVVKVRV